MAQRRPARLPHPAHREHIDGDYTNPPPDGRYDDKLRRSEALMGQDEVVIPREWRPGLGSYFRNRLVIHGAFVLGLSLGGQHAHLLMKLPKHLEPRIVVGFAKKNANFEAKDAGWIGRLWAKRGKEKPIRDREHQLNAYDYILRHEAEGAWVWAWKRPSS